MSDTNFESVSRLENLINAHQADLDKLQQQLKDQNAMLRDAYENDAIYLEAHKQSQEATKKKKEEKDRIIKEPSVAAVHAKVTDLRAQVKEARQALSDYLTQYFAESGLRQITGADGEVREIVTSVRLVKKRE